MSGKVTRFRAVDTSILHDILVIKRHGPVVSLSVEKQGKICVNNKEYCVCVINNIVYEAITAFIVSEDC